MKKQRRGIEMEFEIVKKNVKSQTCTKRVPTLRLYSSSEKEEEIGVEL